MISDRAKLKALWLLLNLLVVTLVGAVCALVSMSEAGNLTWLSGIVIVDVVFVCCVSLGWVKRQTMALLSADRTLVLHWPGGFFGPPREGEQ